MTAMSRRPGLPKIRNFRFNRLKRLFARPLTVALVFALIGSTLIYFTFAQRNRGDDEAPIPAITANPTVASQSCLGGLNIALLADVSGSIYRDREAFSQMQSALKDFVSSLLPSTHTMFSLTQFDDQALVIQNFTNNVTVLTSGVDGLQGGGGTNWTAGINAAYGTFASVQANIPGVLIVATDGDPTQPDGSALASAVTAANNVKAMNIHVLALGIGDNPTVQNLQAISGPKVNTGGVNSDVITTDVSQMKAALQAIAQSTCSTGLGTGTGGTGTGNNGNGTGTGGTGNGTGVGGTGTGSNGTGTGTIGKGTGTGGTGKGTTGSGTGVSVGKSPQPTPTPVPSAPQGTTPSPAPTNVPNQEPTPAPIATETTEPTPTPAPTPTAQGIRTKPPQPQPSPFFDGKQFAPGSIQDNFDPTVVRRKSYAWAYAGGAVVIIAAVTGTIIWRTKHPKTAKAAAKGRKK